jgi:hypothetical protein
VTSPAERSVHARPHRRRLRRCGRRRPPRRRPPPTSTWLAASAPPPPARPDRPSRPGWRGPRCPRRRPRRRRRPHTTATAPVATPMPALPGRAAASPVATRPRGHPRLLLRVSRLRRCRKLRCSAHPPRRCRRRLRGSTQGATGTPLPLPGLALAPRPPLSSAPPVPGLPPPPQPPSGRSGWQAPGCHTRRSAARSAAARRRCRRPRASAHHRDGRADYHPAQPAARTWPRISGPAPPRAVVRGPARNHPPSLVRAVRCHRRPTPSFGSLGPRVGGIRRDDADWGEDERSDRRSRGAGGSRLGLVRAGGARFRAPRSRPRAAPRGRSSPPDRRPGGYRRAPPRTCSGRARAG